MNTEGLTQAKQEFYRNQPLCNSIFKMAISTNNIQAIKDIFGNDLQKYITLSSQNLFSAMITVVEHNHFDTLKFIIDAGYDFKDLIDPDTGRDLLDIAIVKKYHKIRDILIQNGFAVEHKDNDKSTRLHKAVYAQDIEMVKLIIYSKNVNQQDIITAQDIRGMTALHYAAILPNNDEKNKIITLLTGLETPIIYDDEGNTWEDRLKTAVAKDAVIGDDIKPYHLTPLERVVTLQIKFYQYIFSDLTNKSQPSKIIDELTKYLENSKLANPIELAGTTWVLHSLLNLFTIHDEMDISYKISKLTNIYKYVTSHCSTQNHDNLLAELWNMIYLTSVELSEAYLINGNPVEGYRYANEVILSEDANQLILSSAHYYAAWASFMQYKFKDTQTHFELAIRHDPKNREAVKLLLNIMPIASKKELNKLIELFPDKESQILYRHYFEILSDIKEKKVIEKIPETKDKNTEKEYKALMLAIQSQIEFVDGNKEKAIRIAKKAMHTHDENPIVVINLLDMLAITNSPEEGLKIIKNQQNRTPYDYTSFIYEINFLQQQNPIEAYKKLKDSRDKLLAIVKYNKNFIPFISQLYLSVAYKIMPDSSNSYSVSMISNAKECIQNAVEINPSDNHAQLAQALLFSNDPKISIKKLISSWGNDPSILEILNVIAKNMGAHEVQKLIKSSVIDPKLIHKYYQIHGSNLHTSFMQANKENEILIWDTPMGKFTSDDPDVYAHKISPHTIMWFVIDRGLNLDPSLRKKLNNAIQKGITQGTSAGIRIIKDSLAKLKISEDTRLYTTKIYQNEQLEGLYVFNRIGNHNEINKILSNSNPMEIVYAYKQQDDFNEMICGEGRDGLYSLEIVANFNAITQNSDNQLLTNSHELTKVISNYNQKIIIDVLDITSQFSANLNKISQDNNLPIIYTNIQRDSDSCADNSLWLAQYIYSQNQNIKFSILITEDESENKHASLIAYNNSPDIDLENIVNLAIQNYKSATALSDNEALICSMSENNKVIICESGIKIIDNQGNIYSQIDYQDKFGIANNGTSVLKLENPFQFFITQMTGFVTRTWNDITSLLDRQLQDFSDPYIELLNSNLIQDLIERGIQAQNLLHEVLENGSGQQALPLLPHRHSPFDDYPGDFGGDGGGSSSAQLADHNNNFPIFNIGGIPSNNDTELLA